MQDRRPCRSFILEDPVDFSSATWQKSGRSMSNGCVEVAFVDNQVAVRDSKRKEGPVLIFTPVEWEAFLGGVADGQFRLPVQMSLD
jgi:Domain of unknown function (DUF397)